MSEINEVKEKIKKFGLIKDIKTPNLIISTKPKFKDNSLSYEEIRASHKDKKVVLRCLKELHKSYGGDIEFLDKIDLIHKTEYSGHFGEFNCKAFL